MKITLIKTVLINTVHGKAEKSEMSEMLEQTLKLPTVRFFPVCYKRKVGEECPRLEWHFI